MKYNKLLLITFLIALVSCSDNSIDIAGDIDDKANEFVKVQIEFQYGFSGKNVVVELNGEEYFRAALSGAAPLSGAQGNFVTCLPQGNNVIGVKVFTSLTDMFNDSSIVNLGNKEKYFIGLWLTDSLACTVQDSAFGYN